MGPGSAHQAKLCILDSNQSKVAVSIYLQFMSQVERQILYLNALQESFLKAYAPIHVQESVHPHHMTSYAVIPQSSDDCLFVVCTRRRGTL